MPALVQTWCSSTSNAWDTVHRYLLHSVSAAEHALSAAMYAVTARMQLVTSLATGDTFEALSVVQRGLQV
jgi:hypothetical protein